MNVISTESNKLTYQDIPLVKSVDGINYFSGTFKDVRHFSKTYYLKTGSIGEIALQRNINAGDCIIDYHHIKITRESLTDNTAFYRFNEAGPHSDKGTIIPVNPYNPITTFDFACLSSHNSAETGIDTAWDNVFLWMCTCDKDYNVISTPCTLEITIDQYSL